MPPNNKVFINSDNIVEINVIGDQTRQTVADMGDKTRILLEAEISKPLILDDLTQMGATDAEARQEVVNLARTLPYKKAAMVGSGGRFMRYGTNLMLKTIGMSKARYFDSRDDALAWLFAD